MTGHVKFVQQEKGWGIIKVADGREYFFHLSNLINCALYDLDKGKKVEFTESSGPKGLRAENVALFIS